MDEAFAIELIELTKAEIRLYYAATTALLTGGLSEYTIDTGQTVTRVKKIDLDMMQEHIDSLLNRCAMLAARYRITDTAVLIARPAYP